MVNTKLNLSMTEPYVRQIYAKEGDTGRVLEIGLDDYPTENGTLRILRPDGVEKTSDASSTVSPTITDGMATFDSLEEAEVTELNIALSPKQDLHGYANPWPSGGGKNKLPSKALASYKGMNTAGTWNNNVYTNNGLTYTLIDGVDGTVESIKVNGTNGNSYTVFYVGLYDDFSPYAGMILNGAPSGGSGKWELYAQKRTSPYSGWGYDKGNGVTINASASGSTMLAIGIYANKEISNIEFYPMIRPASVTDATYAPYSNICPIYPSNGKNLLHFADADTTTNNVKRTIVNDVFTISGVASATASFSLSAITDVLASRSGTLTLSVTNRLPSGVRIYGKRTKKSDSTVNYPSFISGSDGNMGYPLDLDTYTFENIYLEVGTSYSGTPSSWSIQLEVGSVATTYVPYQGIGVNLCGKNLFNSDISNRINTPITLYGVSDGSVVNFLNTLEVGNYYLSFKVTIDTKNGTSQHNYYGVIIANSATSNIVMRNDVTNPSQGDTFSFSNAIVINESNVGKFTNFWYYCGRATAEGTDTCTFHDFQLERGDEATAYEPYNGTTYPLSLGQSVYGGTLDVVSGKLVVDRYLYVYDGTENFSKSGTALNGFYNSLINSTPHGWWPKMFNYVYSSTLADGEASSMFKMTRDVNEYKQNYGFCLLDTGHNFDVPPETFGTTTTTFKAELARLYNAGTPLSVFCKIAEPQEYDLTPTQISTLLGENNVWSDGEITELTFDYGKLLSVLTADQTAVVGRCIGDVNFTNVSTMPFTLNVIPNNKE